MSDNSFFLLQSMQQKFERLNLKLGEVRDKMEQQGALIRNLQSVRDRRRCESSIENRYNKNEEYGESLVVRRAPNTEFKMDGIEQQRENIFRTRCHINN